MMPHKISQRLYDLLPMVAFCFAEAEELNCRTWPAADRLVEGRGTTADLDEVVKLCIKYGKNALARELLQPPDQLKET